MQQRPPAEEVIRGLKTTSDKIRALAKAGYDRTEISEHLGIVYQAAGFPERAQEQEIPRDHDSWHRAQEASSAPQETGGIPRSLRRQLSGRLHLLQPGRLAAEAGHGFRLRLAPVPQPETSEKGPASTRCATRTARTCWRQACR